MGRLLWNIRVGPIITGSRLQEREAGESEEICRRKQEVGVMRGIEPSKWVASRSWRQWETCSLRDPGRNGAPDTFMLD